MRKYQPIWEVLREKKIAKIIVANDSVKRTVIQAVKKEKCNDIAFKVMSTANGNLYKLHYTVECNEITFFLLPDISNKNL